MPLEMYAKVSGINECLGAFDAFDRRAREELAKILSVAGDVLTAEIRRGAREATGEMKRTISKRTMNEGLTVMVKAARKQWAYQEWGMGPLGAATGKNPPKWFTHKGPPLKIDIRSRSFQTWLRRRGVRTFGTNLRGNADFLVARAIKRRGGVRAKPFVQPVIDANLKRIQQEIREAILRALARTHNLTGKQEAAQTSVSSSAKNDGITVLVGEVTYDGAALAGTSLKV